MEGAFFVGRLLLKFGGHPDRLFLDLRYVEVMIFLSCHRNAGIQLNIFECRQLKWQAIAQVS